jgi:transcriptional regulator of aromatic amino acid metabolism
MKTEREIVKDYREIKDDYAWHPDIFTKDDERVSKIKEIINTKLSLVDKTIILLYADCQSYRKLGKRLGVSHMTIRTECQRIKKIILEEFNNGKI